MYRVTIVPAGGADWTVETPVAELTVSAAERSGTALTVRVRQVGSYGESCAAAIDLAAI